MEALSKQINELCSLYFNKEYNIKDILFARIQPNNNELDTTSFFSNDNVHVIDKQYEYVEITSNITAQLSEIDTYKTSLSCIIQTADNRIIFLKRRTSFAYDKIINYNLTRSREFIITYCIKCIYYMGSFDRRRLRTKLTTDFSKIDPINKTSSFIKRRILFLLFWRKFILDLIDIFEANLHNDFSTIQILPGGKKHGKEDAITTLKREIEEETGITDLSFDAYGAYIRIYDPIYDTYHKNIVFFARMDTLHRAIRFNFHSNNEVYAFEFVDLNSIKDKRFNDFIIHPSLIKEILDFINIDKTRV